MRREQAGGSEHGDERHESGLGPGGIVVPLRGRGAGRRRTASVAPRPPHRLAARSRRDYLPAPLTSFVGREPQIAEIVRLVGTNRLVTLAGAPGVGKTRLALRVAEDVSNRFRDGVWGVELAALAEATLVPSAVAAALGVHEAGSKPGLEALIDLLRPRETLLILDNCEHLLDACATLVDALLTASPELRVLATSREPLGLIGEVDWTVPSLTLPPIPGRRDDTVSAPADSVPVLLGSEAGRLFVERAAAARPGFELTSANAAAGAEICARLDGIPLAIELAAARVRALAVEQIAERLDDRFALLTGGSRTGLPRHRTLRALVDWSHDLLSTAERALLRRLAVFAGGFTLEAAEAVAGVGYWVLGAGESVPSPSVPSTQRLTPVLDLLAALVDKSLVVAEEGQGGQIRYRLLETLRQYGQEKLEASGEAETLRQKHAIFFLGLAEAADPRLLGPEQVAWLDRLEAEHDNLRTALAWSQTAPGGLDDASGGPAAAAAVAEIGPRLAGALLWFWYFRGYVNEGRGWLDGMLAPSRAPGRTAARARALYAAGWLAIVQGSYGAARAFLEESVEIRQELKDMWGVGRSLTLLGIAVQFEGDLVEAEARYGAAAALLRDASDTWGLALVLQQLKTIARLRGDVADASALGEESVALFRETGDRWGLGVALAGLGIVTFGLREYGQAAALYGEALVSFRDLGDKWFIARCLHRLAGVARTQGDDPRATRLMGAAESLLERIGAHLNPPDRAGYERNLSAVRAKLGEADFAAAWADGRAMTAERAVAYALTPEIPPSAVAPSQGTSSGHPAPLLTPREAEVTDLIARGLSNRQIAEEMSVSERTVEWHVSNLLGKLGLQSRAQLAVWAAEAASRAPKTV